MGIEKEQQQIQQQNWKQQQMVNNINSHPFPGQPITS